MKDNACKLSLLSMSTICTENLVLRGKSIKFQQPEYSINISKQLSINSDRSDIHLNPMRHSKRIKQLFLPVCSHEVKHEIANHYRDVKYKKVVKERINAKRSATGFVRQRKKPKFAKLVSTAIMNRRRFSLSSMMLKHRPHILSQREVLQIPSFQFPR